MKTKSMILVALAMTLAAPAAHAEKVLDSMRKAETAYKDGRLSTASRELQYALGALGKALADAYTGTVPDAPDGWTAQNPRGRAQAIGAMGYGVTVERRYREDGGRGTATAQLIVDNPMIQAMGAMFANPALAQNAGYDRLQVQGQEAMIRFQEDRNRGEVVMLFAGRVFLKVEARNIDSEDVLEALAQGWDIAKIREVAELQ